LKKAWQLFLHTKNRRHRLPGPALGTTTCGGLPDLRSKLQATKSLGPAEWFSLLHRSIKTQGKVAGVPVDEIHGDICDEDICEWGPGGEVGGCLDGVGVSELIINLELPS
jgi:hypothetical protein